jgi:hypothetical protein
MVLSLSLKVKCLAAGLFLTAGLSAATIKFDAVEGTFGTTLGVVEKYGVTTNSSKAAATTGWQSPYTGNIPAGSQFEMVIENTLAGSSVLVSGASVSLSSTSAISTKTTSKCTGTSGCTAPGISETFVSAPLSPGAFVYVYSITVGGETFTYSTPLAVTAATTVIDLLATDAAFAGQLALGNDIQINWSTVAAKVTPTLSGTSNCKSCTLTYTVTTDIAESINQVLPDDSNTTFATVTYTSTPEPASFALIGLGLLALPLLRRRSA